MSHKEYKKLFHMRSPPIVKSMYRLQKESELKRAKTRARMAARADTKAKARVRISFLGLESRVEHTTATMCKIGSVKARVILELSRFRQVTASYTINT